MIATSSDLDDRFKGPVGNYNGFGQKRDRDIEVMNSMLCIQAKKGLIMRRLFVVVTNDACMCLAVVIVVVCEKDSVFGVVMMRHQRMRLNQHQAEEHEQVRYPSHW